MPGSNRNPLPRWRGFNLLELFSLEGSRSAPSSNPEFLEDDFRFISGWGFDFVRLPMDYRFWTGTDLSDIREDVLERIDRAVAHGESYGLHVCVNFHRGPGYCVNRPDLEPFNLWKDQEALDVFCHHWKTFALRYRGVSSERLSFDIINEPPGPRDDFMSRSDHERVIRAVVSVIRGVDPERLIIADGVSWGNDPSPELADLGIAQSCRAYLPMAVSHYRAPWVKAEDWPEPAWPGNDHNGTYWDRSSLENHYAKWADLGCSGTGVHCGEGGAFNFTPHPVLLSWFRDVLEILTSFDIGWALWNFRGSFGVLDSAREDADYEDFHGHKLDRALLDLLQEH
ncbi:MAG: cellulase family glycosylhydrolase [Planctomycetes bacterium]|nr:cellulase family glycosylhydrolase [Planctomycetota bacterium]